MGNYMIKIVTFLKNVGWGLVGVCNTGLNKGNLHQLNITPAYDKYS